MGHRMVRRRRGLGVRGLAPDLLVFVALGEAVKQILFGLLLSACTPSPVVPVVEAGDGGRSPCATLDEITSSRLVRNPDGTALVVHCPDSGTE